MVAVAVGVAVAVAVGVGVGVGVGVVVAGGGAVVVVLNTRPMNRYPRFALRTVRHQKVRINGLIFVPPKPAPQLEGRKLAFGLYWTADKFQDFVCLWGTSEYYHCVRSSEEVLAEQRKKDVALLTENGYFNWQFWRAETK